jgi:hypothetical protein
MGDSAQVSCMQPSTGQELILLPLSSSQRNIVLGHQPKCLSSMLCRPQDLRVGGAINVHGRDFLLYACDAFTRQWYEVRPDTQLRRQNPDCMCMCVSCMHAFCLGDRAPT